MYHLNNRRLHPFAWILSVLACLLIFTIISAQDALPSVNESEPTQINQIDFSNHDNSSDDLSMVTDNNALSENAESGETANSTITPRSSRRNPAVRNFMSVCVSKVVFAAGKSPGGPTA